ncbi:MAG: VOC family protein [Betaproteobacteria bacterium]|jgi:catechol 2,3-dioxygenase
MRPQLKHAGIYVDDIDRMEQFYTRVFDMVVTDRGQVPRLNNRRIVFMSAAPDAHHQMVLLSGKDPASGPSVVFQFSFILQNLSELRTIRERLEAEGAQDIKAICHGNAWSVYASDPEGNGLEAYLDTPWHVTQPHGVPFDLSKSDDEIHAWTLGYVKSDPSFMPRELWLEQQRAVIGH